MSFTIDNNKKVLAIDTSCDETSVAVLEGRKIMANVVSSQVELHKKWGGVVPDVARRAHIENLPKSVDEAIARSRINTNELDYIAVTQGPGLAIDLEVGMQYAVDMSKNLDIPLVPVNHMEGHLLSSLLLNSKANGKTADYDHERIFPALGMLISGKHTEIIVVQDFGIYEKVGKTLDDAAGEAFDKFGRMLGFGYPGGPVVSEFAKDAKDNFDLELPIPMQSSGDLNFSYSGLKTACLYKIKELREEGYKDKEFANDICKQFIDSVVDSITIKLGQAIKRYNPKVILSGGGVYKSERVVRRLSSFVRSKGVEILLPEMKYRGDNAAMIGIAGQVQFNKDNYLNTAEEKESLERVPRLSL